MESIIQQNFDYDPKTGEIFRLTYSLTNPKPNRKKVGSIGKNGYVEIRFDYYLYYGHRLAWLLFHGKWPEGKVDHINGNKSDNRIENLRDVSHRENLSNQKRHRDGKLLGAHFDKNRNSWLSSINIQGKSKYLGRFKTELEAHEAYINKKKEIESNGNTVTTIR